MERYGEASHGTILIARTSAGLFGKRGTLSGSLGGKWERSFRETIKLTKENLWPLYEVNQYQSVFGICHQLGESIWQRTMSKPTDRDSYYVIRTKCWSSSQAASLFTLCHVDMRNSNPVLPSKRRNLLKNATRLLSCCSVAGGAP